MAEVRKKEKDGESFAYVVLHNGMDTLMNEIDKFCKGEYGRSCDLYEAYIAKRDPSNYPAKVHEFEGVGANLLEKVRNHLERAHDIIKFKFDSEGTEFTLDIVPGSEEEYLVDRMRKEDIDILDEDDTVVMIEMSEDIPEAEDFLHNL